MIGEFLGCGKKEPSASLGELSALLRCELADDQPSLSSAGNHQLLTNKNIVWVFDCLSVGIVDFFPFVGVAVKLLGDSCERVAGFYGIGL